MQQPIEFFYHDEQALRDARAAEHEIQDDWDSFVWNIHEYMKRVPPSAQLEIRQPEGEPWVVHGSADEILNLFNGDRVIRVDATVQGSQLVVVAGYPERQVWIIKEYKDV